MCLFFIYVLLCLIVCLVFLLVGFFLLLVLVKALMVGLGLFGLLRESELLDHVGVVEV